MGTGDSSVIHCHNLIALNGAAVLADVQADGKDWTRVSGEAHGIVLLQDLLRSCVNSSSSVMPQIPSYSGLKVRMFRLFSSLKTLSCDNFEMPVRNTNLRSFSCAFGISATYL